MIHTSGLLRVTDVIKDLRCGVVTIVTLLVDWRNDYSACSTLTCFRGFLHYDMTRSVLFLGRNFSRLSFLNNSLREKCRKKFVKSLVIY